MTSLSVSDRRRFTPAHYGDSPTAPVYILGPLGWRERGRLRADVTGIGVRLPSDTEFADAAAKSVEELDPANKDELLGAIEAFRDVLALPKLEPLPAGAKEKARKEHQAELDRRIAIARPYDDVLDALRTVPKLARLFSMRALFNEMTPPLAAAHGLRGWENLDVPFRRGADGVVPDELLNRIPPSDLVAIGAEVLSDMAVSLSQRGN